MRKRIVGAGKGESVGMVEVEGDSSRKVRVVQLVGIPQAALRKGRQDEEKEHGNRTRNDERKIEAGTRDRGRRRTVDLRIRGGHRGGSLRGRACWFVDCHARSRADTTARLPGDATAAC